MLLPSNALISLSNAGFKANDRWLVRGINLMLDKGEIVTLIGTNGSGKSTTAKLALGILKPHEGKVERSSNLSIGYVPQKVAIDWTLPLTVERFMTLTSKSPEKRRKEALERVGVRHLEKEQVRTLSGGEFQRVLLARALSRKPDLLVLDEPVQGVDFKGEAEIYTLIQKIRAEEGCGILLISHDLHVVMAATDRVLCLNGHVCCEGTPSSVASNPAYLDLFGTHAQETFALYEHRHDHTHLSDGHVKHEDGSITDHSHPEDEHHDNDVPSEREDTRHVG